MCKASTLGLLQLIVVVPEAILAELLHHVRICTASISSGALFVRHRRHVFTFVHS